VVAANANGDSAPSDVSNSFVPSTVPGAPTDAAATTGNGAATVSFDAPTDDGGDAISAYEVTCTSNDGGVTGTASGPASPIVVGALSNGHTYSCIVTASNVNGAGAASDASNDVIPTSCLSGICVSIGDAEMYEGDSGTHVMRFAVTLSEPATSPVTVHYSVVGDTVPGLTATGSTRPTGAVDFKLKSGEVKFTPSPATGKTPISKVVAVTIVGNTVVEPDETFNVVLSGPSGGGVGLGRNVGHGTIRNDDGIASGITVGIGDASIVSARDGKQTLKLAVTLSAKSNTAVSVAYTITSGSATYSARNTGGDYGGKTTGVVTFNVGGNGLTANVKPISVPIWPDAIVPANEDFVVTLSGLTGTGVSFVDDTATATILGG
jgi:hypothetical protein